ncbi:hypothetical protein [Candidatus Thiosymbion oneisti]|uniref:hypothetical protein n=1 Tax=Candidatus Thiosymbion oneisti TaxID=589554 RepID=UPI000B7F94CE|nr:hypothetical protein [Candidatus Thiosymbion oneisti]
MQPIRQILEEAPDAIPIPEELKYRRIELIIWPLGDKPKETKAAPNFKVAQVERIDIPSREERNVRR